MNKFIQHIILFIVCISSFQFAFAQQNNSIYFLNNVQQSNQLNPSVTNNCKFSIGGIIMPITGQILPPLYFNYSNNAFAYKNLIYPGEGMQSDSLVTVFSNLSDASNFINKLKETNYLSFETNIDIIQATLEYQNQAFTFSITDKITTRFYYGSDFIRFLNELNGKNLLGTNAKFKLGYDFNYYREYALGYKRKLNEKLSIGAKGKLLFGKASIYTESNKFQWKTDPVYFDYTFTTDMQINYSIPGFEMNNFYYSDSLHEFIIDDTIAEIDATEAINYFINNKNVGLGIDLGATYILNDKFTFYGSVIDLGYIKWKSNSNNISNNGNFEFNGVDVTRVLNNDSLTFANVLMDTIFSSTEVKLEKNDYIRFLPTKIYFGSTFTLNEEISFGALIRNEIFQKKIHSSLTLSMNSYLSRKFQTAITYSIINNSFFNFGLGLVYNTGPFQVYVVNDNITGMIFPQTARNVNFRFGINWVFGCGVTNTTLIE
jgi:Family of unknown function (DUF5723)